MPRGCQPLPPRLEAASMNCAGQSPVARYVSPQGDGHERLLSGGDTACRFGIGAAEIRLSEIFPPVVSNVESRVRRHKGALRFFGPAPRARGLRIVLPTPACDPRLPLSLRRLSSRR